MNKKLKSLIFLTANILLFHPSAWAAISDVPPAKRALVIAIGNYPSSGGWPKISSMRDVPYVQKMLNHQAFANENITLLLDSMATRKGIEKALQNLISVSKPGDIVVIHISSHGEQIEDNNGDEPDGLDEAIVPWDAVYPAVSKNFKTDTTNYLRDDIFGAYVEKLRSQLGKDGDLVVFMDACHSGSGTRGLTKIRGGKPPLVSSAFNKSKFSGTDTAGVFEEKGIQSAVNRASYIVFSAARAEEFDYEILGDNGLGMGSLTYAVCKAMDDIGGSITYQTLFSKVQGVLNIKVHNQHPVMEGSGGNRQLFGGHFVQQQRFFTIEKINKNNIEIAAGKFAGFDTGAIVGLYPVGTEDASKAVALDSGIVIFSRNHSATIKLKKGKIRNIDDAWVFLLEPVYNLNAINLKPVLANSKTGTKGFTEKEVKTIKDSLKSMQLLRFDGQDELLLRKGLLFDSVIIASSGNLFAAIDRKQYYKNLNLALQHYSQYRFLEELRVVDTNLQVKVSLIPLVQGKPNFNAELAKNKNGIQTFKNGEKAVISVTNLGKQGVYINIIDLQPDGIISAVLPNKKIGIYADSLFIKPGQTKVFNSYTITFGKPFGDEVFKVFVSRSQMDLEYLVNTRGAKKGDKFGMLEKLVKRSYETKREGKNVSNNGNSDGAVQDVIFEIVK